MDNNKSIPRAALVPDPNTGYLIPDYFGTANWAYSPPLRKFVDAMPGLGPNNANALGQYIPVAVPDITTYPGTDYYEIAVVEFTEQMHSDLPPTTLRGYVQLSTTIIPGAHVALTYKGSPILKGDGTQAYGVDTPHYLGPAIVANRGVPVRIKFYNLLPTGAGGNLFIPVDTTVMGAGMGPLGMDATPMDYTQNRANIHLHGNNTVWISDGTPHQWITPAGENTPYPQGVSVVNVPDMENVDDPRDGMQTLYYTNAQSARLMFYHDHSYGITRLNVYVGEASAYLLTDRVEQDLINGTNQSGVNPSFKKILPDLGIPLVIQDKTFVDAATILDTDPTWAWGTTPSTPNTGDLWYPHVYSPAQNPWDISGANPFGRWMYGPWFWPPTTNIEHGPIPNPYYDPVNAPEQPPMIPATPNPSMPGEAFMDTPIVNGTAYPYLEVEPKAYRFRILNAANDRFFNLQMYVANPDGNTLPGTGYGTEVRMVPSCGTPGIPADWPSGIPDPSLKGPDWIQIGTEGGFLPAPVVIPSQPITWNLNPTNFNFGNVDQHSLLLGAAERADVIVDFSMYAGKTLILYNDSPAAFPAADPRYDYYTGNPDQTPEGGAPPTQPGYGPNTRTIMQIRVAAATPVPYDITSLEAVFAKTNAKRGVFEASQDTIIIPQAAYNSAYNVTNLPGDADSAYVQLHEFSKTFQPIYASGALLPAVTLPLEPKALQDEMGEVYDTMYGRMSGMLGLEFPVSSSNFNQFVVYGYASPPVEIIKGTANLNATPIGSLNDGTQIWKITHNGVDTHTIHTHLFSAQLINRVAWDGALIPPDANELGWKETFRVNPLEHTIIAMRPNIPSPAQVPFEVPNSLRLIDPTMPEGAVLAPPPPAGWFDPLGNPITQITNHYVNFGWEYVYHCHILAHEEMDMMHSMSFAVPPRTPSNLIASIIGTGSRKSVYLTWMNNSKNHTSLIIQRALNSSGPWTNIATLPSDSNWYTDQIGNRNDTYYYRVFASNTVGDTGTPGFPTITVNSDFSNVVSIATNQVQPPAAPTNLTANLLGGPRILLTWRDNAINETGFVVERSDNGGNYFVLATVSSKASTGTVTYTDRTVIAGYNCIYRVAAVNQAGLSNYSNSAQVTI
ncbi:choice-of-anchor D domain-containing protein [Clostridium malenominatum]|uniref:Choice-of-anchor D domain-containing protein n=1 Tax=Clostridium malenominatum TaxID=1539 RepID=A0ABP3TX56_9CLOT